jgi:hypothetical protein
MLGDALAWAAADVPMTGPGDLPECGWSIDLTVRHLTVEVRLWDGGQYLPCPDLPTVMTAAEYSALEVGQRENWVRYHGICTAEAVANAVNRARLYIIHEEKKAVA